MINYKKEILVQEESIKIDDKSIKFYWKIIPKQYYKTIELCILSTYKVCLNIDCVKKDWEMQKSKYFI